MGSKKKEDKIQFTVAAEDKDALERAISYINLQSGSDYKLIHHELHEVGLGTIEVSQGKVIPEFLFAMGMRYYIYYENPKLDFS